MFGFFWARSASVWIAGFYVLAGLLLALFPVTVSTVFVWALAGGAGVYGAAHLWRYLQGRRAGHASTGDLFLTVLPAAFALFALMQPQAVLSVLPLVLGSLLLIDGVGKVPLCVRAMGKSAPGLWPLALSCLLPLALGTLLLFNPFTTVQIVVRVFGISLIADGASDFATVWQQKHPRHP